MVSIDFAGDQIRVAPGTEEAWKALAQVITAHDYRVRKNDTASYNCRNISGTSQKSLHAYGIALDINWQTNPWKDHPGTRDVIFSDKQTQDERANDVRDGTADTDMTAAMIADALAIRTNGGHKVFEWGGTWNGVKDAMHFELDLAPSHLEEGIDWNTVASGMAAPPLTSGNQLVGAAGDAYTVSARHGLRLRSGPSTNFDIINTIAFGSVVYKIAMDGQWMQVSRDGDGAADGHMHASFLTPVDAAPEPPSEDEPAPDALYKVIARTGLRVRGGPGEEFEIVDKIAYGQLVTKINVVGDWMRVSTNGDAIADGFMHTSYLIPAAQSGGRSISLGTSGDFSVDWGAVAKLFDASARNNVERHWPAVEAGLIAEGMYDPEMLAMALGTIKAESAGFEPINEYRSKYNTKHEPFDLYDAGTKKGKELGNTKAGDGPLFRGRGFIQLTGRYNYQITGTRIGVGVALIDNPDLANDSKTAGRILANFLKNKESKIREALARSDLKSARKLVNGGSHGLSRFTEAYTASRSAFG